MKQDEPSELTKEGAIGRGEAPQEETSDTSRGNGDRLRKTKRIIGILIPIAIAVVVTLTQLGGNEPTEPTTYNVYHDQQDGLSFSYPSDWRNITEQEEYEEFIGEQPPEVQDMMRQGILRLAGFGDPSEAGALVVETIDFNRAGEPVPELDETAASQLAAAFSTKMEDFQLVSITRTIIDKGSDDSQQEAWEVVSMGKHKGKDTMFNILVTVSTTKLYLVLFVCQESAYNILLPAYDKLKETIELPPAEEAVAPIPEVDVVPKTKAEISGTVLYSDDFSDGSSGWDTYEDEEGSSLYEEGWLHIINYTTTEYDTISLAHQYFEDFVLEVESRLVAGTDENLHIIVARCGRVGSYYAFSISADGWYSIVAITPLWVDVLVEPARSIYIRQGKDITNLVRVECVGTALRLSVNGNLLAEVTDTRFRSGDIGLGASSFANEFTEVAFDNVVVTAP